MQFRNPLTLFFVSIIAVATGCSLDDMRVSNDEHALWAQDASGSTQVDASTPNQNDSSITDASATDAAPRPQVTPVDNVQKTTLELLFPLNPADKSDVINDVGALDATEISGGRDITHTIGVLGGQHITVIDLPDGYMAGSFGADPCIIAIIVTINSSGQIVIHVYHFTATDDAKETLDQLGNLPAGTTIALAGGNGTTESDRTLAGVMEWIQAHSGTVTCEGYLDRTGLWVDNQGHYHYYSRTDLPSTNQTSE